MLHQVIFPSLLSSRGRCPAPSPVCSSIRGQSEWLLCWWREEVCRKGTTSLWFTLQVWLAAHCYWQLGDLEHESKLTCVCVSPCRYWPDRSLLRLPVRRLCSHHSATASPSEHLHHPADCQDDRRGREFMLNSWLFIRSYPLFLLSLLMNVIDSHT